MTLCQHIFCRIDQTGRKEFIYVIGYLGNSIITFMIAEKRAGR